MPSNGMIIIRADASASLGGGHVYRMLTLATALEAVGHHIHFFVNSDAVKMVPALKNWSCAMIAEGELGAQFISQLPKPTDLLIIDHYGWRQCHSEMAREAGLSLVVMDDLIDRSFDCDMVINQNYGIKSGDYEKHGFRQSQMLLGTDFALLRPEFARSREACLALREHKKGKLESVLLSLGAGYHPEILNEIMSELMQSGPDLWYRVMTGKKGQAEIYRQDVGKARGRWTFIDHSDQMAKLYGEADIAIGAAGSSVWERSTVGLPGLHIILADNQKMLAQACADAEAGISFDSRQQGYCEALVKALWSLTEAPDLVLNMQRNAATLCDGHGVNRVVQAIEAQYIP